MMSYLDQWLSDPENAKVYAQESFVIDCLEQICACMEEQGMSRAALARALGTSRANITQILNGKNVTLRTIAAMAHALGMTPELRLTKRVEPGAGECKLRLLEGGAAQHVWGEPRSRPSLALLEACA